MQTLAYCIFIGMGLVDLVFFFIVLKVFIEEWKDKKNG